MKKQINKVLKKIQKMKTDAGERFTRTDALKLLEAQYDISYTVLVALAKWGRNPKQDRLLGVLNRIVEEYDV